MSATTVDELRSVWGGVRVDDVCAVDRALRTGSELNRSPVEMASYVFASDASRPGGVTSPACLLTCWRVTITRVLGAALLSLLLLLKCCHLCLLLVA